MIGKMMLVLVALVASAAAQTNQPTDKRWLTTQTKVELGAVGSAIAADCYSTAQFSANDHEQNVLVKPFYRSPGALSGVCLGTFGAVVGGNRLLINHRRWRTAINWTITAVEAGIAAKNMRLKR